MALMAQWGAIVTEKPVESMPYNATGNALTNLYILLSNRDSESNRERD